MGEGEKEWLSIVGRGAQPRQFHKGGKSGRFLKSVNFLRLSLFVSLSCCSLPFLFGCRGCVWLLVEEAEGGIWVENSREREREEVDRKLGQTYVGITGAK